MIIVDLVFGFAKQIYPLVCLKNMIVIVNVLTTQPIQHKGLSQAKGGGQGSAFHESTFEMFVCKKPLKLLLMTM